MKTLKPVLSMLLIMAFLGSQSAAFAKGSDFIDPTAPTTTPVVTTTSETSMVFGDIQTLPVKTLSRVSVSNPDIVDVSDAAAEGVTIVAKRTGQTTVFLWDSEGKHIVNVRVFAQDLKSIRDRIMHVLAEADIKNLDLEANDAEGKVIISGKLPKEKRLTFEKILDPFAEQIMNLVREGSSEELVQVDMQITELSTTLDRNLGIDWTAGNKMNLNYGETNIPNGGSKDWFKFGKFDRTSAIVATINLLINEGQARDLSRPRLVVTSGKEATINVGGEVPIQSTTTNSTGGLTQSNVTFKQYGVTLTVTPTIKDDDKVDVMMNVQVSDVDKTFPVSASTTSDIAYKTRSAQTQLMLDDRQTVVFAGLIRYNDSEQNKRIPLLSKIPVVGNLFKSKSKQAPDEGKELVITLTPTILRTKEYVTQQLKMPSDRLNKMQGELDRNNQIQYETLPAKKSTQATYVSPAAPNMDTLKMPATAPAMPSGMTVPATPAPYVRDVQLKISRGISYPYEAIENSWEGTVKLKLRILRDGTLAEATVAQSSGHEVFDNDALNTAKTAAPYGSFPEEMSAEALTINIPIVYSQGTLTRADTQKVVATY